LSFISANLPFDKYPNPMPKHIHTFLITLLLLCFRTFLGLAQQTQVYSHQDIYFRTGIELFDKQQYIASQESFRQYIQLNLRDEKMVEAQYYLAFCALKLEEKDADILLDKFVQNNPDHPKALTAYYDWGIAYYEEKNYDKAIDYFEKVSLKHLSIERKEETQYKLGLAHFHKKQYTQAEKYFNELKAGYGDNAFGASYYAGYIAFREKRLDLALKDFLKASEGADYQKICPIYITHIYYQQNRLDELIGYTVPTLNKNTALEQLPEIYLMTADAYFQKKNYNNALNYFKQYMGIVHTEPAKDVLYRIGFCEYQTQSYQQASESLKGIADENSKQGQYAAYYLGLSYFNLKNKEYAVNALQQAKNAHFDVMIEQESTWLLAKMNYELERYDDAITHLKYFVESYPQHPERKKAIDLLGKAYLYSNQYDEALAYIESIPDRTQNINGTYQQISYAKASEVFNKGEYVAAINLYEKSLRYPLLPDLVLGAKFWKAEAFVLGGNPQTAIPLYQELLSTTASYNQYTLASHYGLGYAYYNHQKYDMAIPHFQLYIARVNQNTEQKNVQDAYLRLADCYFAQRDYNQALTFYNQVIQQNTADKDYAYFQKGVIQQLNDNFVDARANFDMITNQYPGSVYYDQALYEKGVMDLQAGSNAVAINEFTKLIVEKPASLMIPDALLRRALAYHNIGNKNEAIQDYTKIVNDYTTHANASSALFSLQTLLSEQGREADFQTLLAKYQQANPNSQTAEKIYFDNARNTYFNQQYQTCINLYNQFLTSYPQSVLRHDAKYFIGESYYRLNDQPNALLYHEQVIKEQKGAYLDKSAKRAADLAFAHQNYSRAIQFYRMVASMVDNKIEQNRAWEGLVKSYYEIAKYDSLNYFADQIIQQGKLNTAKNLAMLYKGKALHQQGQTQSALTIFKELAKNASDENSAEGQYLWADIEYKARQYKESLETLFDLNKKFTAYENWRGKAYLLMADNYIALGETFQAKATLQSIIDKSPDVGVVAEAKKKLKGMN
jgi:tetratricopeptide (TPR) repeat protein